jgi:hypothetical protein
MSVRAFTNGYDFYSPYRQYIWHEYTRSYRVKHWDDHGTEKHTGKTSGEMDVYARNKVRQLFGQEEHGIDLGKHGLGTARTLREYELFGGFDFKNCRIQDFTLQVQEPPNPPDFEAQFISKDYIVDCSWDVEHFLKEKPENDVVEFLTFGIETRSGQNIYRNDFVPDKHPEQTQFKTNKLLAKFKSVDAPYKIVMYAHWKEKKWGERYEKNIEPKDLITSTRVVNQSSAPQQIPVPSKS